MKIRDIFTEGLGDVLSGAAGKLARGIDYMAGGTGQVGTTAGLAKREFEKIKRQKAAVRAKLPRDAMSRFEQEMKSYGIDLSNTANISSSQLQGLIKYFADNYFAVADNDMPYGVRDQAEKIIRDKVNQIQLPTNINRTTIQDYFTQANDARTHALDNIGLTLYTQAMQAQQTAQAQAQQDQAQDQAGTQAMDRMTQQLEPQVPEVGPSPGAKPLYSVITPSGEKITKHSDGYWLDPNGEYIGNPQDIKWLERQSEAQRYSRSASVPQAEMPDMDFKASVAPTNKKKRTKRRSK